MVRRLLVALSVLVMLLSAACASAAVSTSPESVTMNCEGQPHTLSVLEIGKDEDGNTTVTVTGTGDSFPIVDGVGVAPFVAEIQCGSDLYKPSDILFSAGKIAYSYPTKRSPDSVILIAYDAVDVREELAIKDEYGFTEEDRNALYAGLLDDLEADLYGGSVDAAGCAQIRGAYTSLANGSVIQSGAKGDKAKALQKLLIYLGADLKADGSAGKMTFQALADVQAAFGIAKTDAVDAAAFRTLIDCASIVHDPEGGGDSLPAWYGDDQVDHMVAAARQIQRKPSEPAAAGEVADAADESTEDSDEPDAEVAGEAYEEDESEVYGEDAGDAYTEILAYLENDPLRVTYQYLLAGGTLASGSRGEEAKEFQQLLASLGTGVKADGNIGKKTIQTLHAVQAAFHLDQTDVVDLGAFCKLLECAALVKDPEEGISYLPEEGDLDQQDYMQAAAYAQLGRNYTAQSMFEDMEYADSAERAANCVQKWPGVKELYHNPAYKSSRSELQIRSQYAANEATFVKVYCDEDLAATAFLPGGKRVTIKLPPGQYEIRIGYGTVWYGPGEAFGDAVDAAYQTLIFEDGSEYATLQSGYQWRITLNMEGGNLGSNDTNWSDF